MSYSKVKSCFCQALLMVIMLSSGCAIAPLVPGADAVVISSKKPAHCKYIGPVWSFERNGVSQSYNSKEHLRQDVLNRLKNKAVEMGADTVVVTKTKVTYDSNRVDLYEVKGSAYRCQ